MTGVASERWRLASTAILFAAAGVLLGVLALAIGSSKLAADFQGAYLPAAEGVWRSGTPYTASLSTSPLPYVYPPVLAEALVPLTVVPVGVAAVLAALASLAAVLGAIALVGVRDPRCYAAVVISAPGWQAVELANVSAFMALALALLWRYRSSKWPSACSLGAALAVKLFVWPMLVWTVAGRRFRTTGLALAVGFALLLCSWAIIGFDGISTYARRPFLVPYEDSYSFAGVAATLGLDPIVGRIAIAIVGGSLLIATALYSRRGDDERGFTCAVFASLVFSPVVWIHYFVLLFVPLGIARPSFSAVWLVPIVLWMIPEEGAGSSLQMCVPAVLAAALLTMLLARPRASAPPVGSAA